jgi:hypothetical protein
MPEVFYSDRPIDARLVSGRRGIPDRMLLAPVTSREDSDDENLDSLIPAPGETTDDRAALARLPETLQERIRRQLWGRDWEAARDARAQKSHDRNADGDDTASRGEALESLRPGEGVEMPGPTGDMAAAPGDGGERSEPGEGPVRPQAVAADGADTAERGAASGAGTNTDPNLFGSPSNATGVGSRFELALGARVHGPRPGGHRPAGEPPPPTPDARPTLASRSRAQAAQQRMPIPPAYEAIVRELFAHRTAAIETAP